MVTAGRAGGTDNKRTVGRGENFTRIQRGLLGLRACVDQNVPGRVSVFLDVCFGLT